MNPAASSTALWTRYERALVDYAESTAEEAGLMGAFELGRATLAVRGPYKQADLARAVREVLDGKGRLGFAI
jgi:hypothetical protein